MRKLVVDKKTGFKIKDFYRPVIIRDERGILFYSTEDLLPRTTEFNLPAGTYFIDSGTFVSMSMPVPYTMIKLPPAQRWFYPSVGNFPVKFINNPNKCSVDWDNRVILFDHSFKEKPLPVIDFILSHEIGHKYYPGQTVVNGKLENEGECYADWFAANRMIKKGYNPSQIGFAQLDSLSDKQRKRKNLLINKIVDSYDKTRSRM